jgi:hypothetical protein
MAAIIITPTAPALAASALNCAREARMMGRPGAARAWIADARAWRTGRYPVASGVAR